ncbi:digestive cysteine proteinase 2-like [Bolinopsis microptera]|uniref:digestive cysteine proteinase 2-like n=1 Tax=Bolinopsis microptera TaxID=2820187 RepID=UPI003078FC43
MRILLLLTLIISLASSIPLVQEFFAAMDKYHGMSRGLMSGGLPSGGDKVTERERFLNFKQYKTEIDRINGDDSIPYSAEVNMFSTLTEAERRQYTGLNISKYAEEETKLHLSAEPNLPTSSQPKYLDWVSRGANPPMKNQGSCGSCWAFGTISSIESTYFLMTGDLVPFAEQELLDCTYETDGCKGGWLSHPINYVKHARRLASSEDKVYNQEDGSCSYSRVANSLTKARVTGYQTYKGDSGLISGLNKGVVSVAIYVGNTFHVYKNGIYKDVSGCQNKSPNHAVSVVGYGNTGGENYWKVRNSWGAQWGDKGYIRMSRDVSSNCGISEHIYRPIMQCTGDCNPPQFDEQEEKECKNLKKETYCDRFSDHCDKGRYYGWMTKNCKKTCGICEGADNNDETNDNNGGKCPTGTVRCSDGVCKHEHMCHYNRV